MALRENTVRVEPPGSVVGKDVEDLARRDLPEEMIPELQCVQVAMDGFEHPSKRSGNSRIPLDLVQEEILPGDADPFLFGLCLFEFEPR